MFGLLAILSFFLKQSNIFLLHPLNDDRSFYDVGLKVSKGSCSCVWGVILPCTGLPKLLAGQKAKANMAIFWF